MADSSHYSSTRRFYTYLFGTLLVITAPLLFLRPNIYEPTGIWDEIWNLGHIPFFAIISYFAFVLLKLDRWYKLLIYTFAVLVASVGIEFIQANIGRSASAVDVGMNLTGAMLVVFWMASPTFFSWAGRILAAGMFLTVVVKTTYDISNLLTTVRQMPVIAHFETEVDIKRWRRKVEKSEEYATEGHYSGKFRLRARRFSTYELSKIYSDWRGYETIEFDIYNPNESNMIMLFHIQDNLFDREMWNDDRFRAELELMPGLNKFSFDLIDVMQAPSKRELDLADVRNLRFTSPRLTEEKFIYIDNIRLQ